MAHPAPLNINDPFRILDHMPLGVLVLDADYRVRFWNKCLEYWTGVPESEIFNQDIRVKYGQFAEKRFAARIASIFQGGPPVIFSSHIHKHIIPARLPNNMQRLQHVTVSAIQHGEESFLAMFSIQDVTEVSTRLAQRKKAEDELRQVLGKLEATNAQLAESNSRAMQLAEKAEAANTAKSIFLANMSHEIRTPMSGILGALDMLASSEQDDEKRQLLRMTQDTGRTLLHIINDILDLSKVEAGKMELALEETPLLPLLNRCMGLYSIPAREKGVALKLDVADDLPASVQVDATRLEQILRNLVDNALKFTSRGSITLAVEITHQADDHNQEALLFSVHDTGIGMSQQDLARIFQPFSQADSSYAKTFGGTGLGLALCKRLVELMNGTIHARGEKGQGSTFSFSIPVVAAAVTTEAAPRPTANPLAQNPSADTPLQSPSTPPTSRILVAEDVALNQEYLGFLLKQHGYECDMVDNGMEAVRAFQDGDYDLILMDIQMPELDGLEATRRIRRTEDEGRTTEDQMTDLGSAPRQPASGFRSPARKRIPIIALTAYVMHEEQEKFLASGMDGFVAKPVQADQLFAEIKRLLPSDPVSAADQPAAHAPERPPHEKPDLADAFDLEAMRQRFMGNDALWRKIVAHFVNEESGDYQDRLKELDSCELSSDELEELARLAHKLKGALGTLCADPAREKALRLEQAAKAMKPEEVAEAVHELLAELEHMAACLLPLDEEKS